MSEDDFSNLTKCNTGYDIPYSNERVRLEFDEDADNYETKERFQITTTELDEMTLLDNNYTEGTNFDEDESDEDE